jgi:hypothetical protein
VARADTPLLLPFDSELDVKLEIAERACRCRFTRAG